MKANGAVSEDREAWHKRMTAPGQEGYKNRFQLFKDLKEHEVDAGADYNEFARRIGLVPTAAARAAIQKQAARKPQQQQKQQAAAPKPQQQTQAAKPQGWTAEQRKQAEAQLEQNAYDNARLSRQWQQQSDNLKRKAQRAKRIGPDYIGEAQARAQARRVGIEEPRTSLMGTPSAAATPVGVTKGDDGKWHNQYELEDGSLTTDFGDVLHANVQHEMNEKMHRHGLDPEKVNDDDIMKMYADEAYDAALQADKAANQQAVDEDAGRTPIETMRRAATNYEGLDDDYSDVEREVKRAQRINPDAMVAETMRRMPPSVLSRLRRQYGLYFEQHPKELKKGQNAQQAAEEAIKGSIYQHVFDKLKAANAPKSTLEYLMRKIADQPLYSQHIAAQTAAGAITGNHSQYLADEQAMSAYENGHPVTGFFGTLGNMAADPTMYLGGWIGSMASKAVARGIGRAVVKGASEKMAERLAGRTLAGRIAQGVAAGAGNLGFYEGSHAAIRQDRTGEHSIGDVLAATGRGVLLGAATGVAAPLIGNVADKWVARTASTGGKLAVRTGETATSVLAEGTIFAAPELVENARLADGDPNKRSGWSVWAGNVGTMAGFKGKHLIESAPRVLAELRTDGARRGVGFEGRLRNMLDRTPADLQMTNADLQELRDRGYGGLADLYTLLGSAKTTKKERESGIQNPAVEQVEKPKDKDLDGYATMQRLMDDHSVSAAVRAKAYYLLTGKMLPMPTVLSYDRTANDDGTITITALGAENPVPAYGSGPKSKMKERGADVVVRKTFKSKKEADVYEAKVRRQIELNTVDVGEQLREAQVQDEAIDAAIDVLYPKGDRVLLKNQYYGGKVKSIKNAIDKYLEGQLTANSPHNPHTIRRDIEEKYGVDIDKALKKEPNRRTKAEADAVQEYANELYNFGGREETAENAQVGGGGPAGVPPAAGAPSEEAATPTTENAAEQAREEGRKAWTDNDGADDDSVLQGAVDEKAARAHAALDRLNELFDEEAVSVIKEDPEAMLNSPALSEEHRAAIQEYIEAMAGLDGVKEAAQKAAEQNQAEVENEVVKSTNKETKLLMPATVKDDSGNPVSIYVVDGKLVLNTSGGIDPEKSAQTIVIYDPNTGQYRFVDPKDIVEMGQPVSPADAVQSATEAIQQRHNGIFDHAEQAAQQQKSLPAPTAEGGEGPTAPTPPAADEGLTGSESAPAPEEKQPIQMGSGALGSIPKNEKGEPVYEQAEPSTAWQAILEQTEGDTDMAAGVVDSMIADKEAAVKKAEKEKPKHADTIAGKIAAEKERKAAIERAKAELEAWKKIAAAKAGHEQAVGERKAAEVKEQEQERHEAAVAQAEQDKAEQQRKEGEQTEHAAQRGEKGGSRKPAGEGVGEPDDHDGEGNKPTETEWENETAADREARIREWLSDENLEWAEGKSLQEIVEYFGNELEPIAVIPKGYLKHLGGGATDSHVYCGKGYFIDHAVNHHDEEPIEEYLKIQDILSTPTDVKIDTSKGRPTLLFIKQYDKYYVEMVSVGEDGTNRVVLHKSFFHRKKMPHKALPSVAIEKPSADEITAISPAKKNEAAGSSDFSALDDSGKDSASGANAQEDGGNSAVAVKEKPEDERDGDGKQLTPAPKSGRRRRGGFKGSGPAAKSSEELFAEEKHGRYSGFYKEVLDSSSTIKEAVQKFVGRLRELAAAHKDWSSRKYKSNSGVVAAGSKYGELEAGNRMRIDVVNEKRRENTLRGIEKEAKEIEGYIHTLLERCGISQEDSGQYFSEKDSFESFLRENEKPKKDDDDDGPDGPAGGAGAGGKGKTLLYHRGPVVAEPNEAEQALLEAVNDVLKGTGIEVVTDTDEGQKVLDAANGKDVRTEARHRSEESEERNKMWRLIDRATAMFTGKTEKEAREARRKEMQKITAERKEMYDRVLSGNFDEVTLRQIDNYIDNFSPYNNEWRPISKRLPQKALRGLRKGERASAVDVLFSRISESAVPKNERAGAEGKRRIEEKKKELLKKWAIATGNWHTSVSDFTDAKEPLGSGKDSDVYQSKDGKHVIKVSKGKDGLKKFRPDIDAVTLFNYIFPESRYKILGYGEVDGKFVKFLKQPVVDFTGSKPLSAEERVAYMADMGFKPVNKEKTAFSNGTIVVADLQGNNIVRDKSGNIRVIDADVKLHTKDFGGQYSYPPVEADTALPQANNGGNEKPRMQKVYHGSGADFDEFDNSHMGEGEGAQAYGWGTYVTEVEGIGRTYAKATARYDDNSSEEVLNRVESLAADLIKDRFGFRPGLSVSARGDNYDLEIPSDKKTLEQIKSYFDEYPYMWNAKVDRELSSFNLDDAASRREFANWVYEIVEPFAADAVGYAQKEETASRHLYTVEIPDDNGENYLDWDKPLTEGQKSVVLKGLKKLGVGVSDFERRGFSLDGKFSDVYSGILNYGLRNTKAAKENAQEATSKFLSSLGFAGIKYPAGYMSGGRKDGAMNYVIFNEKDARITDHVRFFRTPGGGAYGFTVGGKIYVDPRIATADTPIHEYAHLWGDMMRRVNPKAWGDIVRLMKGKGGLWGWVKKNYPELETDDEVADEVLAQFSGKRGAERLREEMRKTAEGSGSITEKAKAISALQRVKEALGRFWRGVAELLHIRFTTAEEVADRVMADMLHGVDPRKVSNDNRYNEFAEKHKVDANEVKDYATAIKEGNLMAANRALSEIRRTLRVAHREMNLQEFGKFFRPINQELAERFGDIEKLRQEHIAAAEREHNAMEAARKKAEEEEAKKRKRQEELSMLTADEIDKRYAEALERGDEAAAREMLDEAARRNGYGDTESDYQGVGAWVAPSNPGYESDEARRADVEDNAPDVNLEDMALGYNLQPDDYFTHPERYSQDTLHGRESTQAIHAALEALKRGDKDVKVKVYRAVPTSVKEGSLRNGDWVTPSRKYAEMHGKSRLEGKYRIIEDEVPAKDLWWDGNDANEFGYDDGRGYKYKNTKNNRKLNDLVTRDDDGNIIPPSKRFNEREQDVRYSLRHVFGGNSGYVGYSMSKRAAQAREDGRYPKTDFRKEYSVTPKTFDALVDAGVIDSGEWHHTSMYGNKTPFYGWKPMYDAVYAANKKEVDKMARTLKMQQTEAEFSDYLDNDNPYRYRPTSEEYQKKMGDIDRQESHAARDINLMYDDAYNPETERKRMQELQSLREKSGKLKDEVRRQYPEDAAIEAENRKGVDWHVEQIEKRNKEREALRQKFHDYFDAKRDELVYDEMEKAGILTMGADGPHWSKPKYAEIFNHYKDAAIDTIAEAMAERLKNPYDEDYAEGISEYRKDLQKVKADKWAEGNALNAKYRDKEFRKQHPDYYKREKMLEEEKERLREKYEALEEDVLKRHPEELERRQKAFEWPSDEEAQQQAREKLLAERLQQFFEEDTADPDEGKKFRLLDDDDPQAQELSLPEGEPKETLAQAMVRRVKELAAKLGAKVRIVTSADELPKTPGSRQRRMKGMYDTRMGEVTIVIGNHENLADVENTVLHEVVGHRGFRVLFDTKEKLDHAMDELYRVSSEKIRKWIDDKVRKLYDDEVDRIMERKKKERRARGEDPSEHHLEDMAAAAIEASKKKDQFRREATEEYGAHLAGRIGEKGFEKLSAEEQTFWGRLKSMLQKALQRLAEGLNITGKHEWTNKDWAYVLHEAYKREKNGGRPSIFDEADTIAMRMRTGFGEKKSSKGTNKKSAQPSEAALKHLGPTDEEHKAKVRQKRETAKQTLKEIAKAYKKVTSSKGFISDLVRGLRLNQGGTGSGYGKFETSDGKTFVIRVSNHNVNAKNVGNEPVESIVIKTKRIPNRFHAEKDKYANEYVYFKEDISKAPVGTLSSIAESISELIDTGVYHDKTGLAKFNSSPEPEGTDANEGKKFSGSDDENPDEGMMFRDGDDDDIGDVDLGDAVDKMREAAVESNASNLQAKREAMKAIGGNLSKLRQAMARQKVYDKGTVKSVTDMAREMLQNGMLDKLSGYEAKRILSAAANVTGAENTTKQINKLMDVMVDNQLRNAGDTFGKLLHSKGTRVNASGVEVQGQLDPDGAATVDALKKGVQLDKEELNGRIGKALDKIGSEDKATADQAANELTGLQLASRYVEDIKGSKAEEAELRESLKEAKAQKDAGKMSADAYKQYCEATEDAIRQNKIERADAYRQLIAQLGGVMGESAERAKAWREAEKQRVQDIQHNANSDMQGRPCNEHHKPSSLQKLCNSDLVRGLLAPLATFEQMLRMFGNKNVRGEGYLWNRFVRSWLGASENEYSGYRDALKELDDKVSEIFGKKMRWGDIFSIERKLPTMEVKFWDGGEMKPHTLTQGNLAYIYMVDKMSDGRMKLRAMGITEGDVEQIAKALDPRLKKLADWMQDEFLVQRRNKYNEVHKRMFGASMAAIENYFPLKILSGARTENVDVADDTGEPTLTSTTTGSIIKRRRNNLALDVTNADAFSVILEHLQDMEHWAAYSEFNRDLNTLLSYRRFKNQVMNMSSAYGAGETLWKNFRNVCQLAAGSYRPPVATLDKTMVNLAKLVTAAKISGRIFTALKQFLSFPAYLPDANAKYLLQNLVNPVGAWKWSMENLPLFHKRWNSRMAGDPRLLKTEMDWKVWRSRVVQLASKYGMSPNAFVDAVTVAMGAHAIYKTKLAKYLKQGYDKGKAEEKARQDAEIAYNQTQQSSEGAFLSTMQADRTWASVLFTVFRNSAMSYTRQEYDALRNLARKLTTKGYKEKSIEFMAKQMVRDGLDENTAWRNAKRTYSRSTWREFVRVATFGYILQLAWNLGAYLPYLLLGDNDDEKKKMKADAGLHALVGSVEGLTGGDVLSTAGQYALTGEGTIGNLKKEMPLTSDLYAIYQSFGYDAVQATNDVINLLIQAGVGVNPQSLTDAVVGVMDYCENNPADARECALLIARIFNTPQSQLDKIYFDEIDLDGSDARKLSPKQIAERYAKYKLRRNTPLTAWMYGEDGRKERVAKYEDAAYNKAKEKLSELTDNRSGQDLTDWLDEYKQSEKTVSRINKLQLKDPDKFDEEMTEFYNTPAAWRYDRINDYMQRINDLTRQWQSATTRADRMKAANEMVGAKQNLVNDLKSMK